MNTIQYNILRHFFLNITLFVLCCFIIAPGAYSQTDSTNLIKYTIKYKFSDGIFLDYQQVIDNQPIPPSRIVASFEFNDFGFYDKLLEQEEIVLFDNVGMKRTIQTKSIWGYCRNGVLYVQYNDSFNRIPVIGSICHFVANKVSYQTRYDPMLNGYYNPARNPYYYQSSTPVVELVQYILDFKAGVVYPFTPKNLLILMMDDTELYDEYNDLRSKKQKKLMFFYLRKYNERNPLLVPENS